MTTSNPKKIRNYSEVLAQKYGKPGSPERIQAEEEAYAFFAGQELREARREAKITQQQLAALAGTTKSYVSKVENGITSPSVSTFARLAGALGLRLALV